MRFRFIRNATTSNNKNVLVFLCCLSLVLTLRDPINAAPNASSDLRAILKQSLDAGDRNAEHTREYSSSKQVDEKQIDADGSVRSETLKRYDPVVIDGVMLRKLVSKDNMPLPPSEERKEEERVKRLATARKRETSTERAKRLAEEEKKRTKQHEFSKEIMDGFQFHLLGEEKIDGRMNWIVEATPEPDYKPKELRAQIFPHLKGKIWIDQQDGLWSKAEAMASDPISVGFGVIAKLDQGARLSFHQTRMPDGVWLLRDWAVHATAHVMIVKRVGIEQVTTFDNFRKVPPGIMVLDDAPSY